MTLSDLIIPGLLTASCIIGCSKRIDVYDALTCGAEKGLKTLLRILPSLVALLTAVNMLRASGAMELLSKALAPVLTRLGIPAEALPLMLLRPMSGSGALAVGQSLMEQYGADSQIGRTAAVMLGSTETTFYTLAVYFGAAKVKHSRHAVPAALIGDLAGFLAAAWTVRFFFD